jgi:alkaline phosphatase D
VVTWDDHEVEDDYAGAAASGGQPGDADFTARRDAAYQAWWEHMPVRLPPPGADGTTIYRSIRWGALAQLVVLDGRQYRSGQPCGGGFVRSCPERDLPEGTMLGAAQEAWLAARLAEAAAADVNWTVLVNQVLMTDLTVPLGDGAVQANMDACDGYPQARRRLLQAARDSAAPNLVVLTGDLHCSVVGDLQLDGATVGTEFLGPSISSPFPTDLAGQLALAPLVLPQIKLAQGTSRGYLSCAVDPTSWRTDYRWVQTVARPDSVLEADGPSFVVDAGTPGARRV